VGKQKKRTPRYITYVHLNPMGLMAQPVASAVAVPQPNSGEAAVPAAEQGEVVEIEVGGRKIRGRILKVLENEKAILLSDENRVLRMIPLSELRKRTTPILI